MRFDCETTIFFCVYDLERVPSLSSVILKIYIFISARRHPPTPPPPPLPSPSEYISEVIMSDEEKIGLKGQI